MAKKGEGSKTARALTAGEVNLILKESEANPRDQAMLDVAVHIGLRASDITRLEWPWVLNSSLTGINSSLTLVEQKTKRTAEIPITSPIRKTLTAWWIEEGKPVEGVIFPSRKGGDAMTTDNLNLILKKYTKRAGLSTKHVSSHSLRKSFGRAWIKAGNSMLHLMERFGHSSPDVTKRYIGLLKEEVDEDAEAIDFHSSEPSFVTNAAGTLNPEGHRVTPIDDKNFQSSAKSQPLNSTDEPNEAQIIQDFRRLGTTRQIYVFEMLYQEMKEKMIATLMQGNKE